MRAALRLAVILCLLLVSAAPVAADNPYLDLDFEAAECSGGWYLPGRSYESAVDSQVVYSGRQSLRLRYDGKAPWQENARMFGVATRTFPLDGVAGKTIRYSGFIKTENVANGYAGLWWRVDGESDSLAFDNMSGRGARGTTPWTRYQIELAVPAGARGIYFGVLHPGDGTAWFDGLSVEIEGERWVEGPPPSVSPPSEEAVAWLRKQAVPFTTVLAGNGFADLAPLKKLVGNARIVALGEGTHGTKEFFQMKHRLTELLASEMGFTHFAIEANMPESYRVNDFVLYGKGEPKELLQGMYFWTWNTQEVLDMILWMRQLNQSGKGRIQFLGFDMQTAKVAAGIARDFVTKAEPGYAATLDPAFAAVEKSFETMRQARSADSSVKASAQAARDVLSHLESRRVAYLERFKREEVDWAIQNARVVAQAAENVSGERPRDQSMADNVAWILDQAPAGSKIVLWAHNAHVSRQPGAMGAYLAERFGKEMVVLGFAMDRGSYTAVGNAGLAAHESPAAPAGSVESFLRSAGLPRFILDLRDVSFGSPAWSWLASERPFRGIGAGAVRCAFSASNVAQEYDGLVYIAETTPSVLLPR